MTVTRDRSSNRVPRSRELQRLRCLLSASVAVIAIPAAGAASAQSTPDKTSTLTVQDVVVTATKRKENLRKVPQSITAVTATQLRDQQIVSFDDLAAAVPSVASTSFNARAGQSSYAIRGVSAANGPSSVGQQTTGIYLDDIAMTMPTGASTGAATPAFFDVAQVEVLRGPQGTLYGAGSMGGTIRIISNQPNLMKQQYSFEVGIRSIETGGVGWTGEAVANLPIVKDLLAIRLGVHQTHDPGFIDRINGSTGTETRGYNDATQTVAKLAIRYQPDGTFTVTPSLFYQRTRADGDSAFNAGANDKITEYLDTPSVDKVLAPALTISKDFGFATLTSASAYLQRKYSNVSDSTAGGLGFDTTPATDEAFYLPSSLNRFSEEMRLVSPPIGQGGLPISYVVGAYFSHDRTELGNYLRFTQPTGQVDTQLLTSPYASTYGYSSAANLLAAIKSAGYNIYSQWGSEKVSQYSGFGEVNYQILPKLTVTFGFRYLSADLHSGQTESGWLTFSSTPTSWSGTAHSTALTPKFAVRYDITPNASVYGTAVEGFRLGGINQPTPTALSACATALKEAGYSQSPTSYQPDSVWNYEIGEKSTLFDRRVATDVSLYRLNWNKVQQDLALSNLDSDCAYDFIVNEGKAQVNGVDASLTARVSEEITAHVSGSFTDAEIVDPGKGQLSARGNWLAGIPRWNLAYGINYAPDAFAAYDGFVNADVRMVGPEHASIESTGYLTTFLGYHVPAYSVLNVSSGFSIDGYRIAFSAKNLANDMKIIEKSSTTPYTYTRLTPRTFGIDVSKSF